MRKSYGVEVGQSALEEIRNSKVIYFFWKVGLCGASGVVFAFILLASFTGFNEGEIPLTFILVALIFIGQQVYEGITVHDDISNMAHIVGGLVGGIMGYTMNKKAKFGY